MSKQKWFLNISDIASFIGQNKWDYITPFERLWKRCDKECYASIIESQTTNIGEINGEIAKIQHEQLLLVSDLEEKKLSHRQYTIKNNKLEKQKEMLQKDQVNLQEKVDNIHLTQQEKLQKALGNDIIEQVQKADLPTEEKRTLIQQRIEQSTSDKNVKEKLESEATSFVNKTHGTLKESSAIEMFQTKLDVVLDTSQTFYSKQFKDQFYIGGKLDGICWENSYLVEVKNRTRGFFSNLRDYEKTQIQLYMWIIDFPKAKLVEKFQNQIRITEIYRDEDYITDILMDLGIFTNNFQYKFLGNMESKKLYITLDEEDKKTFIYNLYLRDIYNRQNEKLESNQDCEIDDDL